MFSRIALIILASMAFVSAARADSYDDGVTAFARKEVCERADHTRCVRD